MNKRLQLTISGIVLLDLQKAFGTVDHHIIWNKLKSMGIDSTDWSYLQDRKQLVTVGRIQFDPITFTC